MTQITLFVKTFSRFFFSSIFDIFLKIGLTCLPKKINQTSIINSSIPKFPNTQIKTKSRSISPIIFRFLFEGPVGFNCSVCCLKLGTVAGIRLSGHFVSACLNRTYHVYLITFHNYSGQFNQSLPEWPSENDFVARCSMWGFRDFYQRDFLRYRGFERLSAIHEVIERLMLTKGSSSIYIYLFLTLVTFVDWWWGKIKECRVRELDPFSLSHQTQILH